VRRDVWWGQASGLRWVPVDTPQLANIGLGTKVSRHLNARSNCL